jgi:DNA replication and repair protein RecF
MYLKKLTLTNFKNYESAEFDFSPRINCLTGNNGVGKTNILDAIHYLSLTKSFFNNIDSISIRHGEDYFIIKGIFERNGDDDEIYCAFQKQKPKILKRNSKEYQKLSEHVGRYPVVMISPADSALVSEGSEERRKFMNKIISQYNPGYLDSILRYSKALQQRNKLLNRRMRRRTTRSRRESGAWSNHPLGPGPPALCPGARARDLPADLV